MSLQFPDWYQGGFPDRELVVMDMLQPVLDTVDVLDRDGNPIFDGPVQRRPFACTFLPQDYGDRLPIVRVFRGGGAADSGTMRDPAMVQVAVIADSREESWQLLEFCRQWLLSYSGGTVTRADGSKTLIDCVEELVGPAQIPELNPDKRLAQLNFRVTCRKPRGLPDYQKVRESL
ncbi:phage tail termination protein [Nocardia farcinica]|uniref:phage tail termination protein n=1 Tax=Nocardia farcinica TaxID=37329 RepID=UPI0018948A69|nr:hypothetical protein [Nocardia farcinica]MBF6374458.1 hypothetical protein [Nocardia farcinica]MBF6411036.1 hypothetical protein [Nocardia farcinica]